MGKLGCGFSGVAAAGRKKPITMQPLIISMLANRLPRKISCKAREGQR